MKTKLALSAIVAAVAVFSQAAFAQASAPASGVSRDQRRADTAAANKAGKLTPAGEGGTPQATTPNAPSTKTRDQRRTETASAAKAGKLTPAGEGGTPQATTPNAPSTRTRAERKTETASAARAGKLTPAGEGGTKNNQ
jgi:hypothetical protein